MNEKKVVSIKDIAALSGVSIATVSRIINKKGRYSKETEKKVMDIIESHGYVSNMAAKSLREAKSHTVGLIVPDISNDFFSTISLHVEKFFADAGYSVFICNSANDSEKEKAYFRTLDSKLVDGIICISGLQSLPSDLTPRNIPIVCIDRYPENDKNIPIVSSDDTMGSYLATEHLIKKDCKNILFIANFTADYNRKTRYHGYEKAMKDYNMDIKKENIIYLSGDQPSYVESEVKISNMIQSGYEFDGIFASSDRAALGALYALKRHNIDVPNKVKIIGFDNSLYSRLPSPSISTISRNTTMLAENGSQLLLDMMKEKTIEDQRIIVPINLIERESSK